MFQERTLTHLGSQPARPRNLDAILPTHAHADGLGTVLLQDASDNYHLASADLVELVPASQPRQAEDAYMKITGKEGRCENIRSSRCLASKMTASLPFCIPLPTIRIK
jgi:hypothetical protein